MLRVRAWGALVALVAAAGCSGRIDSSRDSSAPSTNGGRAGAAGGAGGRGGSVQPPPGACKLPDDALPAARVWRLSPVQLANTFAASFGVTVDPARIPADSGSLEGFSAFETKSDRLAVTEQHARVYRELAGVAADALGPQLEKDRACLFTKAPAAGCVSDFVEAFAGKAFRRPVTAGEKQRFTAFFDARAASWDGRAAVRLLLIALFQHPAFLYRSELGEGTAKGRVSLTQLELASELSYGLADGPPDADLMDAARTGKLADPAVLRAHAERLAKSDGARRKIVEFFQQLFGTKGVADGSVAKNTTTFPEFTDAMRASVARELPTFVDNVLFAERGSVKDLFSASFSYLDANLAKLYKATAGTSTGGQMTKTSLPAERRGVLGQASVLAVTSHPEKTSPAERGLVLYRTLLCQLVPTPPDGALAQAGKITSPDASATQREHWAYATANAPECVSCHRAFVPLGLGFEQFDAIGRYRTSEFGKTLDTSVELKGFGSADGKYGSALELGERVADSDAARRCFAMQLASYTLGRVVDADAEGCAIDAAASRFAEGGMKIEDLLVALTAQDGFVSRYRQEETQP